MNIKKLILEGEGVTVDFKKTITSFEKIAKTMTAFANSRGGRLLIGVEDTGEIIGVRSEEEEKFMIRKAGSDYCKPSIVPHFEEVYLDNRMVLVAEIRESSSKPQYALSEEKKWWAYMRVNDKSVLASKIMVDVLKKKGSGEEILLKFTDKEKLLLEHLQEHEKITFREYCKLAGMNRKKASRALVNLILMGLIRVHTAEKKEFYSATGKNYSDIARL